MAVTITNRSELVAALAKLGVFEGAAEGVFDALFAGAPTSPEVAALTPIATVDAIDPATTQALVNECKAKINAIISALQA